MEEFLINYEDKLKNCMETQVLLGNGNIIIRNFHRNIKKFNKKVDISYLHLNEYLIYADKNDKIKYLADKKDDLGNDKKYLVKAQPFILYYILYYNTNKPFFNDLRILNKKNGLKEYITKYKIELVNSKLKENLNDVRGNYIGFFYDIRINKDYINIEDNENNEKNEKENFVNIIKNINDYDNKKNKHSYDIINEINFDYIHHKSLSQNNDIKISNDFNNNIEYIKNGNIIINEKNTEDVVQFIIKFFIEVKIGNDIQHLFEDINNDNSRLDINIQFLSLQEVKENIQSNTNEILLMTKDNLEKLKSFISYDIIYKYFELKKNEDRKELLKQYIKEFYNFYLFYQNKISTSPNFSLIKSYEDCINNGIKNNIYIIYRANKIAKKILLRIKEIENIYYFTYKRNSYIYFEGKQKIFQLKFEKNYWKLIPYDDETNINVLERILDNTQKSIYKNNLLRYLEDKHLKGFYLINEKWLISKKQNKKDKYETTLFKPQIKLTGFKYKYPINFRFMEKNEKLINRLLLEDKTIDKNDIKLTKMFFVSDNITNPTKIYFGISEGNVIYFYIFEKQNYKVQFLIDYTNKKLKIDAMKNNILPKGIETYLYEMRININHKGKQNLINNNLEKIGIIINLNVNNEIKFIIPEYSSKLEFINDSYFYVNIIQCLVNIEALKDIFLNRNKLLNKKIVTENRNITFHFYKLMELIWLDSYNKKNIVELEKQSKIFLKEIKEKFVKEKAEKEEPVLQNFKLLIEFILLSMHYDQQIDNKDILEYSIKNLKDYIGKGNTFIYNIFLFRLNLECCPKNFSTNCLLSVDLDIDIKNKDSVDIKTILSKENICLQCDQCKKMKMSKIKFLTTPPILIIALQPKTNCNIKFIYSDQIEIEGKKYELISIITKNDNDPNVATYCKSSIHASNWRKYKKDLEANKPGLKEIYTFNDIKSLNNIPYVLVYRQIKN